MSPIDADDLHRPPFAGRIIVSPTALQRRPELPCGRFGHDGNHRRAGPIVRSEEASLLESDAERFEVADADRRETDHRQFTRHLRAG